jgi:hypothetical protein
LLRITNWIRKKLHKPIKFDYAKAIADAEREAAEDLARLADPAVLAEVESWENVPDPLTDGIACGHEEKG